MGQSLFECLPLSYGETLAECGEGEVYMELKRIGSDKSPGHDGLSYELYLRVLHIFVSILTEVFNK